jgi:osmotically-inducible protein OsmY
MNSRFCVHHLRLLAGLSVVLLTVACASADPKSPAQVKADRVLAADVQNALDTDPDFYFRHVYVQADNGRVWLSGYVWSTEAIEHAQRVARHVAGVTSVVDRLELERQGGTTNGG